ncbi:alpha/beta hydrolase domain-containing protein [Nonomuraea sp. NPDC050680]|uniref:alpha/beta hydrolase domain-containing protein n=1 Tax=Nonomuraea sp. NPDC050680 TaxID=3154630 RepID=UPI0033E125D3
MNLERCPDGQAIEAARGLATGYTEEEYLMRGTAASYADELASYVTRILVRRPEHFSGTVVVEWFNVSSYMDAGVEWQYIHSELLRSGMVWVGVSAQCLGVTGSVHPVDGPAPGGLKASNPERYGMLDHPGDDFSYDIFSQAGRAIRELFPGARLIAAGMSLGAYMLTTYINEVDPIAQVYDGFLPHCRIGIAPALVPSRWPATPGLDGTPVPFRADPRVPVLALVTETDVITAGYAGARRPDGPNLRVWELAGASHADTYLNTTGRLDLTHATPAELAAALTPTTRVIGMDLRHLANSGPQHHYVAKAAVRRLDQWVREDVPPPQAPPLATVPGPALERDDHGNALGGVRTPWMEVPTAVLTGVSPDDGVLGRLFGLTVPFSPAILDSLYGGSHLPAFESATDDAVAKGFLLADDAPEIKALAAASMEARVP